MSARAQPFRQPKVGENNLFLDVESYDIDEEHQDSWFFSSKKYQNRPTVQSLQQAKEITEKEIELTRKKVELKKLQEEERGKVWRSTHIQHKVAAYGMVSEFTGLADLTQEQYEKLKDIISTVTNIEDIAKNKRAADLVKKWITPEEWKQLLDHHHISIQSKRYPGITYVVEEDPHARVQVFLGSNPIASACGVTSDSGFPDADQFLNKIIAIKSDEKKYFDDSNVSGNRGWLV